MVVATKPHWCWAMLRQRCPACREGRVFAGSLKMHPHCPACGWSFQREPGYFLGALYVSYGLSLALLGALTGVGALLLPHWDLGNVVLVAALAYVPLMPWVFRMARVIWMYYDWWAWPSKRGA